MTVYSNGRAQYVRDEPSRPSRTNSRIGVASRRHEWSRVGGCSCDARPRIGLPIAHAAALALATLCFFLPFTQLTCAGQTYAQFSGVEIAVGTSVKQEQSFGPPKEEHVPPDNLASAALAVLVIGTLIALAKGVSPRLAGLCGVAGVALLIALKIHSEQRVKTEGQGLLQLEFIAGFWLTTALAAIGAVAGFAADTMQGRRRNRWN